MSLSPRESDRAWQRLTDGSPPNTVRMLVNQIPSSLIYQVVVVILFCLEAKTFRKKCGLNWKAYSQFAWFTLHRQDSYHPKQPEPRCIGKTAIIPNSLNHAASPRQLSSRTAWTMLHRQESYHPEQPEHWTSPYSLMSLDAAGIINVFLLQYCSHRSILIIILLHVHMYNVFRRQWLCQGTALNYYNQGSNASLLVEWGQKA